MVDVVAEDDFSEDSRLYNHEVTELADTIREASGTLYGSSVFDYTAMSPLSPASLKALNRLRAYNPPPFSTWDKLPISRRAAVLLLLFADRRGDLRVVITMRAASLRNYSGHAAFPGGKADSLSETPFQIARREAFEEIGLPHDDSKIPPPFRIEHICQLPFNLAKTELAVRPCVAFLHCDDPSGSKTVEDTMIPRLDAKEVAAVFSAPFHNFLRAEDEVRPGERIPGKRTDWYHGNWSNWHDGEFRMHYFYVPIDNQTVTKPKRRDGGQAAIAEHLEEEEETGMKRYKVWGMTARMLVDAAKVAYGEEPAFEHMAHLGDEAIITKLYEMNRLPDKKKAGSVLTKEDIEKAAAKM
ncbi:MAG: hypothetical protein M1818_001601 [Claussenomyces sp. TS43310]|nr:MAG: hypothetical protein M1818_001601 [Claussenomyces sp. TS43310]